MHVCHGEDIYKTFFLFRDGKWGLTMWDYITAYISENVTSFTEY
jgi:hypothetical protein